MESISCSIRQMLRHLVDLIQTVFDKIQKTFLSDLHKILFCGYPLEKATQILIHIIRFYGITIKSAPELLSNTLAHRKA